MLLYLRNLVDHLLRLPELKGFEGIDFDSTEATAIQREIFKKKRILGILYQEYCRPFVASAKRTPTDARMVEIGSGTSPLKSKIPSLICTDLIHGSWIDVTCSAFYLPFKDESLDRLFLMFVCHHLGRIEDFLAEAYRCLKPGGEIVIVDPAITLFSKFYYTYFHVDKMDLQVKTWGFDSDGRLSDSNIALAWIIFFRDRERFTKMYPGFSIEQVEYNTCLTFLLSGGLRICQLLPSCILEILFSVENWLIRNITHEIAVTMALTIKRL